MMFEAPPQHSLQTVAAVPANMNHDDFPSWTDESVMKDILEELDRERTKRAELEAQVRQLTKTASENANSLAILVDEQKGYQLATTEAAMQRSELLSMAAERDGLKQLVEALTENNAALSAFTTESSLPQHVVRLLEFMPWDPRVRQYVSEIEEVYQWQVRDKNGSWSDQIKNFPGVIKDLPIAKPNLSGHRRNEDFPPGKGVVTDTSATRILQVTAGYPLPRTGSWEWIGGWRIDKGIESETGLSTDEEGWCYSANMDDMLFGKKEKIFSSENATPEIRVRRRRWQRRRVLKSYPGASERTREYLTLLSDNVRLDLTVNKMNQQLLEMKSRLTEAETKLDEETTNYEAKIADLRTVLSKAEEEFLKHQANNKRKIMKLQKELRAKESENEVENTVDTGGPPDRLKGIGAIGQWVSSRRFDQIESSNNDDDKTVSGSECSDSELPAVGPSSGHDSFDWKRLGRTGLLDKIARHIDNPPNSVSNPPTTTTHDSHENFDWRKIGRSGILQKIKKPTAHLASPLSQVIDSFSRNKSNSKDEFDTSVTIGVTPDTIRTKPAISLDELELPDDSDDTSI